MVVGAQKDGPFHPDAVVMEAFDPVFDGFRGIEYCLVDVPATCFGSQFNHFFVIQDRMGDPFFLQGFHGCE